MNLQQLISLPDLDFAVFAEALREAYDVEQPEEYLSVLQEMFMLTPRIPDDEKDKPVFKYTMNLYKDVIPMDEGEEDYVDYVYDCSLKREGDDISYSTGLVPWDALLAYSVDDIVKEWVYKEGMMEEEIIAHILYDVTFYSMTSAGTNEAIADLAERLAQVKRDVASGEIENYPTHEDVFGKYEETENENE